MPTIHRNSAAPTSYDAMRSHSILMELLLTVGVGCEFLYWAAPLALLSTDPAVESRYRALPLTLSGDLTWHWLCAYAQLPWWQPLQDELRAPLLLRYSGQFLLVFSGCGWAALQLARSPVRGGRWLALALWSGMAWTLRPFHLPSVVWTLIGLLTLCIAGTSFMRRSRGKQRIGPLNPLIACVWPGWLLLTGVGLLIQIDFAATGPLVPNGYSLTPIKPGARFFGLNQADAIWLSTGILIVVVGWRAAILKAWVGVCQGAATVLQRPRGSLLCFLLALVIAIFLGWLGLVKHRLFLGVPGINGGGKPHIAGEILRLAACGVLAWFAYRNGEWRGSRMRTVRTGAVIFVIVLLSALGLLLADDKGPLLILALALPMLLVTPILRVACAHWRAAIVGLIGAGLLIGAWRTALVEWLPQWSNEAANRAALMADAFTAYRPTMAQARWLLDASPSGGFGLGRVPYCGAQALYDMTRCTLGSGAPLQMPSDLAYVPLVVTFGATTAACLIATLLGWLSVCVAGQWLTSRSTAETSATRFRRDLGLLPVWLVAIPTLAAQAQTIVSVGAALSWSSLTGVTLPLLGYGGSALCATALWVGLCLHSDIATEGRRA